MLTHLLQSALQINIKKAMKLVSSYFYFQVSWPKPSVLGSQRPSTGRFLWVSVKSPPPLPSALTIQSGDRPEAKRLPPPAREILLHSGPGCKLKYVLPVPWLELLRKTSATSKLITERKHPRLRPGLLWERLDAGREIGCRGR